MCDDVNDDDGDGDGGSDGGGGKWMKFILKIPVVFILTLVFFVSGLLSGTDSGINFFLTKI